LKSAARIYVAGGDTLIGTALRERLLSDGFHIVGAPPDEPDLTCAGQVEDFFADARPQYVFMAAGRSGGIQANLAHPADLMHHNLLVTVHVLQAAHTHGVAKLLYLGSSCSYPRHAPQPLRVESLKTGPLEPSSEAYATAKLAGITLCQAYRRQDGAPFITAIPANPFGPGDDFTAGTGHVIPALIGKLYRARTYKDRHVTVWGTGTPRREFLYVRDLADACLFAMNHYEGPEPINLGGGEDLSIAEVARAVAGVVGYDGRLDFDATRLDGAPLKALDGAPLQTLGWRPRTAFRKALEETYQWFLHHVAREDPHEVPAAV
jgi:GDP-L-fucose synthase